VTFEDQIAVLQQVPNPFFGGLVNTWDVAWELKVDPSNSIVESNENNNVFSTRTYLKIV
jgi:CARDB